MKFAYADPPYLNQAKKHYGREEVDHEELIGRLVSKYGDGWALSCSSPSLRILLPMCPEDVRVMAWVKPFCAFKPNVNPAYAWEPVLVCGGRKRTRDQVTVRDWVSEVITLKRGVHGAKPEGFSRWLFQVFNAQPGDILDDLFPGSGAVSRAWESFLAQRSLGV